jgi:hypothetical protein
MINRILKNTDLAYCGQNRERQVCAGMKYAGDRPQAADQRLASMLSSCAWIARFNGLAPHTG